MIDGEIGFFLMPETQSKSIKRYRIDLIVSSLGTQENAEKDHNRDGASETNAGSFAIQKNFESMI